MKCVWLMLGFGMGASWLLAAADATNVVEKATFGAYTNVAGHVIKARPVRLDGALVHFALPKGGEARYRLSVFKLSEQTRIKDELGETEMPPRLKRLQTYYCDQIVKTRAQVRDGLLSEASAQEKIKNFKTIWQHELDRTPLSTATRNRWRELEKNEKADKEASDGKLI